MTSLAINLLRANLAEHLNRVMKCKERTIITRKGKKIAALVPIEDLQLIQDLENKIDLNDALAALAEPGSVSWEEIKRERGL